MGTPLPQLAAHKGLRGQILLELKRAQPLTARDLAGKLRVSPNAIRHHLKELEAEQLIAYGRDQRGAGTFRLSEHNCAIRAVAERFPEVCAAEERFLEEALGAAVERRTHIVHGCNACEYQITFHGCAPSGECV